MSPYIYKQNTPTFSYYVTVSNENRDNTMEKGSTLTFEQL